MSASAPWLALACDWSDSEMFDDSSHGVRLAWIELLSVTKAQGRAGCVRLRVRKFAEQKRLSVEAVEEMLVRATKAGAITRQGDEVTLKNWRDYQDPKHRSRKGLEENGGGFTKTPTTRDQSTEHRAPTTQTPEHRGPRKPSGSGARASMRPMVSEKTLRDLGDLRKWYEDEITRSDTPLKDSEHTWHNVQTTAAKVLRDYSAKKCARPVGLFKWVVGINDDREPHWEYLDDSDEDALKAMIKKAAEQKRVN